ncbi:MAG TPA: penicillin-binding protein 2 [Acidimicrobiia bacterium]|nr:penicillin-binding protein 2 [Acidimicrobiia bacterium]
MTTRARARPGSRAPHIERPSARPAVAARARHLPRTAPRRAHHAPPPPVSSPRRLAALLTVTLLVFALIGIRLVDVQARNRGRYVRLGLSQRVRTVTVPAQRGTIFDRNGNALAVSVDATNISANPRVIRDPAGYAAKLAPLVGVDAAILQNRLSDHSLGFVYVARKVDPPVERAVRALHLTGLEYTPEPKRYYPATPLAAPILGAVGTDNGGLSGLEAGAQATLAGQNGRLSVEQDPKGRDLPNGTRQDRPALKGSDVVLTIDQSLQYQAERVLADEVTAVHAKGGMAIVTDVHTGDVLVMATVDGANGPFPAHPSSGLSPNRPLTDVFEPGSTAKVVTIAAAIEAGIVSPSTVLSVPQSITVDNTKYEDVDTHPTLMTVSDIVRQSSNVGTIEIARMLGRDRFDAAIHAFGFGAPTGAGYPGESAGILLPRAQYNATSLASMPIGSGIAVTAMQLLDVYLTIANNGVARQPRLVTSTVDGAGHRHPRLTSADHAVVSPGTAAQLRQMLEGVVAGGTGTQAQIPGYRVAGKTGTARKPPYLHPPYNYVASFAGFAPADAPRLGAVVVLDEPQGTVFGGEVAAPAFAKMMQYALTVERVPASSPTSPGATGPIP